MTKRTIVEQKVGEETLRVTEMEFKILKEEWNEYRLENGTLVRMKNVVGKIFHVVDENDDLLMMPDGDPFLMVRSRNQVVSTRGEEN
ncbi:MAG: hypothetical protein RX318_07985 [bacterium]|nr:hypothetical protein [bacterium]